MKAQAHVPQGSTCEYSLHKEETMIITLKLLHQAPRMSVRKCYKRLTLSDYVVVMSLHLLFSLAWHVSFPLLQKNIFPLSLNNRNHCRWLMERDTSDIIPKAALLLPQGPIRQVMPETLKRLGIFLFGGICQLKPMDIFF